MFSQKPKSKIDLLPENLSRLIKVDSTYGGPLALGLRCILSIVERAQVSRLSQLFNFSLSLVCLHPTHVKVNEPTSCGRSSQEPIGEVGGVVTMPL